MDGLASGRALLSTDIPECRLYPEWINIFQSAEEAVALIRRRLNEGQRPAARAEKHSRQLQFARQQTWRNRARTLEHLIATL